MKEELVIQKAVKREGALTRKAKKAKMTVKSYTDKVLKNPSRYTPLTVKQARFAKTLRKITNKNKKNQQAKKSHQMIQNRHNRPGIIVSAIVSASVSAYRSFNGLNFCIVHRIGAIGDSVSIIGVCWGCCAKSVRYN